MNMQYKWLLCLALLCVIPTAILASDELEGDIDPIYLELDRGSPKTVTDTTSPIDVIEAWELARTGITDTGRLIQRLAPSFNFSTSTVSDGTDISRPATLRGMGPDQILVLINGKRRHSGALIHVNGSIGRGSAGVDFNTIPVSVIDRIEILRDGAAAQYGSDAIAGVINIILKSDATGSNVQLSAGQTYEGDGDQLMASVNQGFAIGEDGFLNLTLEKRDRDATNRAGTDPRQQYPTLADGSPDPREETFNRLNHRYGDAESDNLSFFMNSSLPLGKNGEFYLFGGISQREGESGGFYRRALDDRNVPEIYPNGFLPLLNTTLDDYSIAFGYRHLFANDWELDASIITGKSSFKFDINNSVNVSFGADSPTSADAGTLNFQQTTVNLDLTGTLDVGLNSPVYSAFGLEYREDNYEIEAGEFVSFANGPDDNLATAFSNQSGGIAAPGIQVFPGFRPSNEVDASRDNWALYSEFENNLTDELLLGLAARYEDYSDVGNNLTGKVSLRYQLTDTFAVRGSFSSGFRAPSVHQENFNTVNTQFIDDGQGNVTGVEVGTFGNDSEVAKALGVPSLDEETSVSSSFGLVFTPQNNFTVTTDLYHIAINDRIVLSGIFRPESGGGPIATALNPFGIGGAQFFSNAIDTTTEGLDIVGTYKLAIASGKLDVSVAAHWNKTEIDGNVAAPSGLDSDTLYNRVEQVRLEHGQPQQRYNVSLNYEQGPWFFTWRSNYYGRVVSTESASDPSRDQTFDSQWITDIMASYMFGKHITWSVGADNVFDNTPDKNKAGENFNGIFTFNRRTTPFGYNGGFYYTRLGYQF